jgi:hypothetical protein
MRTQELHPGRDISAWRVPVACLGAAWLLVLATLAFAASPPSSDPPSPEPSWVATVRAEGSLDHADVGLPASASFVIRYDRFLDRRTGLHRRSSGGLRMLHAVLRL